MAPIRSFLILSVCIFLSMMMSSATASLTSPYNVSSVAGCDPNSAPIIFGYLRTPSADSVDFLAGIEAALAEANTNKITPGYCFILDTHIYPFCDFTDPRTPLCDTSEPLLSLGVASFISKLSTFHAVVYPQYGLSEKVINAAATLGIPVIDPLTISGEFANHTNVFFVSHRIQTELSLLIRHMLGSHNCAHAGVVYQSSLPSIDSHVNFILNAFAVGGHPIPATIDRDNSTAVQLTNFFYEDPSRVCYVILLSPFPAIELSALLVTDARYVADVQKMFVWSYIGRSVAAVLEGFLTASLVTSVAAFRDLYFPSALPVIADAPAAAVTAFENALNEWKSITNNTVMTATTNGLHAYLSTLYPLEIFSRASLRYSLANPSDAWHAFVETSYTSGEVATEGGISFHRPIRECLSYPLTETTCHCNVVSRQVFIVTIAEETTSLGSVKIHLKGAVEPNGAANAGRPVAAV